MFGRYALDKPGLILANQGEGIDDFRRKIFDLDDSGPRQKSAIENHNFEIASLPMRITSFLSSREIGSRMILQNASSDFFAWLLERNTTRSTTPNLARL